MYSIYKYVQGGSMSPLEKALAELNKALPRDKKFMQNVVEPVKKPSTGKTVDDLKNIFGMK